MEDMKSEREITKVLQNYLQSLTMYTSDKSRLRWHRALYRIGKPAIPYLRNTVLSTNKLDIESKAKFRTITGLLGVLHDIDENESRKVIKQVIKNGCQRITRQRLNTISEFTLKDYRLYTLKSIRIYEHKDLANQNIETNLKRWLNVIPDSDLDGIDRIYIEPRRSQNYNGTYAPIFDSIKLFWRGDYSKIPVCSWLVRILNERTLYHEIGHYVNRHCVYGQDIEQETEANEYAAKMLKADHPIMSGVGKVMHRFSHPFGGKGRK